MSLLTKYFSTKSVTPNISITLSCEPKIRYHIINIHMYKSRMAWKIVLFNPKNIRVYQLHLYTVTGHLNQKTFISDWQIYIMTGSELFRGIAYIKCL